MRRTTKWMAGLGLAVPGLLAGYSAYASRAARRAVPADGRFVDVEGARLHYVDQGAGTPIVMIHGLGGQLRNFSYALTQRFPDRRLILVDRPGSGYSTATDGALDIAGQAAVIARLIAKLGLKRPLVVGHSLGGAIALALALDHPDSVGALALIAPLTQVQEDVPPAFELLSRLPALARLPIAWTLGTPLASVGGRRLLEQIFAPEPVPDDFAIRGGAVLGRQPAAIDAAGFELGHINAGLAAMVPRYPSLSLPVSILYARGDAVLDPALHGTPTSDAIPGARIELIKGGHMIPVTQPDRTAAFIRDAGG